MIKKIFIFLCITLSVASFMSSVQAQQQGPSETTQTIVGPDYYPRPVPIESTNFLGQDHNYSVTFRGNGEAVVSARIIFSNLEESTMSAMTLRVPKVMPQDVMVYQISRDPQCLRYGVDRSQLNPVKNAFGVTSNYTENLTPELANQINRAIPQQSICEEYQEPDYTQYWYGGNTYHKALVTMNTDSILINFPKPIKPNGSGAIIVYYRALGYAKKDIYGAFNYTFETLKVEDRIRTLQVGISTDSDLYLKEAKGAVNYQNTMSAPVGEMQMADQKGASFKNSQLDNVISQIGYGTVVKSSSNLQPLDSYTVKGSYAESQWRFYGNQITMWVVAIVLVLILLVYLVRIVVWRLTKKLPVADSSKQKSVSNNAVFAAKVAGVSFFSALFIIGYGVTVFFIVGVVERTFSYYSGMMSFFIMLLLMVISFAVVSLLLFGPALYAGVRRGLWKGAIVFAATIGWLVLFFILLIMILFVFKYNAYYPSPPIYPMMGESSGSSGVMMK